MMLPPRLALDAATPIKIIRETIVSLMARLKPKSEELFVISVQAEEELQFLH